MCGKCSQRDECDSMQFYINNSVAHLLIRDSAIDLVVAYYQKLLEHAA